MGVVVECLAWVTLDELVQLGLQAPGLRGPELLEWGQYIEGGGTIFPLSILTCEGEPIPVPPLRPVAPSSDGGGSSPRPASTPSQDPNALSSVAHIEQADCGESSANVDEEAKRQAAVGAQDILSHG